ncbi:hypothetical protein GOBAR_DD18970 [Gossypium barbadense]|nr:hypothetical protein GOBAR_DD18970 [Gossypium barbadense]
MDNGKESCHFDMDSSIPLEQTVNGFVKSLETGEHITGSRMRSCLLANSGHLKLEQTLGFHSKAVQVEEEYLHDFDLDVVVLIETRASGIKAECVVKNIEVNQFQFVHLKVKFSELNDWVLFIGIYESPLWVLRKELWVELEELYKAPRLFHFLSDWLSHSGFGHLVNENWGNDDKSEGPVWSFVEAVKKWNLEVFANIPVKDTSIKTIP